MVTTLIVYLVGVVITWIYGGYKDGRRFTAAMRCLQPGQFLSIQWLNMFYQGLAWPSYWASVFGQDIEERNPSNIVKKKDSENAVDN